MNIKVACSKLGINSCQLLIPEAAVLLLPLITDDQLILCFTLLGQEFPALDSTFKLSIWRRQHSICSTLWWTQGEDTDLARGIVFSSQVCSSG